jgi:uncharacterized protein YifN (PemK superfamily)
MGLFCAAQKAPVMVKKRLLTVRDHQSLLAHLMVRPFSTVVHNPRCCLFIGQRRTDDSSWLD